MKKWLMSIASVAALAAGPAFAADMPAPVYKAAPVAAAWTWAGFYVGGHGGYGWKNNSFTDVISTVPTLDVINGIKSKGWAFGAQAGYNWQFGAWVAGLELDGSAADINGSTTTSQVFPGVFSRTDTESDDVKYLGTARARIGYAVTSGCCWNAMIYGTAGLAWERFTRTNIQNITAGAPPTTTIFASSNPNNVFGWVAGAGLELQIANSNWIARAEYLHYDFGATQGSSVAIVGGVAGLPNLGGTQRIEMVRGALSYKFTPGTSY